MMNLQENITRIKQMMGKGWGVFGPNTKRAWNNPEIKKGYLDSVSK